MLRRVLIESPKVGFSIHLHICRNWRVLSVHRWLESHSRVCHRCREHFEGSQSLHRQFNQRHDEEFIQADCSDVMGLPCELFRLFRLRRSAFNWTGFGFWIAKVSRHKQHFLLSQSRRRCLRRCRCSFQRQHQILANQSD